MTLSPFTPGTDAAFPVEQVILPRASDLGGFEVRRALPFHSRRMVGPFIFWDEIGPGEFLTGRGVDVRPHPHIGLSTVTFLFDGSLDHKDSLGSAQRIQPGDVNLMTAGQGIVHSERTGQEIRLAPSRIYGIQSWLAQPRTHENGAPDFSHTNQADLPLFSAPGVSGRVIIGNYLGLQSPVPTQWDTHYLDVRMEAGARLEIDRSVEERALYVLGGEIEISGTRYAPNQMLVLRPGDEAIVTALGSVHLQVLGGATMDGPRYIFWNFVGSDRDLVEEAKRRWRTGLFPVVPGDDKEFIPLPA